MTVKLSIRISTFLLCLALVGGAWAQAVFRGTGGVMQAAEAAIRSQSPSEWYTTHNIQGFTDGSSYGTWTPTIGSGNLTASSAPKVWNTNDTGEPGDTRLSPTGKTPIHFYDGADRRMTGTTNITSTNQTLEFVFQKDWNAGSANFWSAHRTGDTNKNIYFGADLSAERYRPVVAYNGGTGVFAKPYDTRAIGVLVLKWTSASSVTIKYDDANATTADLSAAFASGALDTLTFGGTVYGGGQRVKFWSYAHWTKATTDAEDTARFKAYQDLFGIPYKVDVTTAISGSYANTILIPPGGKANAANNRLFILNHGVGQDAQQMCLQTPTYEAITRHFVKAGWTVGCTTAAGNNWGNQAGIDALSDFYDNIVASYPSLNGKVVMGAHSMGNLLTMNALRLGSATFKAAVDGVIHAGNGVADLAKFFDGEPPSYPQNPVFSGGICSAYALTCASCSTSSSTTCSDWASKVGNYNPVAQPNTSWANYAFYFATTSGDTIVKRASHPAALITLLTGHVVSLNSITGDCDHGDSGYPATCLTRMYVPAEWLRYATDMTN